MDPRKLFVDERQSGYCVFCGGAPESQDHCPSKVLLDEPLPPDLPVVDACAECNNSFSLDEQYLACLIECALCGSATPDGVSRPKVRRILTECPALVVQLNESKRMDNSGNVVWQPDIGRVQNILLKLARGHIAHELSLPKLERPDKPAILPLIAMSDQQRSEFESPNGGDTALWPEIGSRAFIRAAKQWSKSPSSAWTVIQPGRYRYMVSQSDGDFVQIVLSEYLACRVSWY